MNNDTSTGARVLRELIDTPAFREIVKLHLTESDPAAVREWVRVMLRADPEFSLGLAARGPALINALAEVVLALGEQARQMPPEMLNEYFAQLADEIDHEKLADAGRTLGALLPHLLPGVCHVAGQSLRTAAKSYADLSDQERQELTDKFVQSLDGEQFGRTVNAISTALQITRRQNPDLIKQAESELAAAVDAIDFGKLREGIAAFSAYQTEAAIALIRPALRDPVVLSNCFVACQPIINDMILLLAEAMESVDLPPEIVASAIFNAITDLDKKRLARVCNAAASLINQLHEGSMILGQDKPEFQSVMTGLVDALNADLQFEPLQQAMTALAEDGEVVTKVIAAACRRDPQLLVTTLNVAMAWVNAGGRGFAELSGVLAGLPEEELLKIGDKVVGLNIEVYMHGVNESLRFFNRLAESRPDLLRDTIRTMFEETEGDQLSKSLQIVAKAIADAMEAESAGSNRWSPEKVGDNVNEWLMRFNRYVADHPGGLREYGARMFAVVDAGELETAMRNILDALTGPLYAGTDKARAIIRPLTAAAWRAVRARTGTLKAKVFPTNTRGEGR